MKKLRQSFTWALIFITLIVLACAIPGLGDGGPSGNKRNPSVAISSPTADQKLEVGRETTIESVSVDAEGISRVELSISGEVVWVDANANPEPDIPFIVAQPWTPEIPGTYIIQVIAYNTENTSGASEPLVIEVVTGVATTVAGTSPAPDDTDVPMVLSTQATDFVPTRSETPTPTNTAPATPTGTPEPQPFTTTGLEPEGRFHEIWLELRAGNGRLGYPTGPEIDDRNYARQRFEYGLMFWWDNPEDPDDIWVLDSPTAAFGGGATSNRYADTWPGGDEYPCPESRDVGGPVRGFGKVWCDHPELQTRLGHLSGPELGSGGRAPYAHVQFFQGGLLLYSPLDTEVYVLFAQGDWLRFDY